MKLLTLVTLTLLAAFVVACAPAATNTPAPTTTPQPEILSHVLEVISDPEGAAKFVFNPKAIGQGLFVHGRTVTIDVLLQSGWEIDEWVGPVFSVEGRAAKIIMDSSQTVVVRLVPATTRLTTGGASPVATAGPTEIPTPGRTPTTVPRPTPTPTIAAFGVKAPSPTPLVSVTVTPSPTPTPTPVPSPTPTPTATSLPAPTLTPGPTPTPAAYGRLGSKAAQARAFAEPILVAISKVPPDFQDDFATDKGGWKWWLKDANQSTIEIRDGVLRISDLVGGIRVEANSLRYADDFVLQLDARMAQGDLSAEAQVLLRHAGPYIFLLHMRNRGGTWALYRHLPEAVTLVADGFGDTSPPGEVTRFMAVVRGDQGVIYMNGKPVAYIQDPNLDNAAPLDLSCYSAIMEGCEFDNVKYWDLSNLPQ